MASLSRVQSSRALLLPHEIYRQFTRPLLHPEIHRHFPRPLVPHEFVDGVQIITSNDVEATNNRVMEQSMRHVRRVPAPRNSTESYIQRHTPRPLLPLPHELFDQNILLFPSSNTAEAININAVIEESMRSLRMVPASKSAIESLNKVKIGKDDAIDKCSICLEEFSEDTEVSATPCKHLYHHQCITQWLETSHFCPLCRYSMSTT